MLDSSYNLTDEERDFIRAKGLPDPIALGWLQAKRRAEGKSLRAAADRPFDLSDLFGGPAPGASDLFGGIFKNKD